MTNFIRSIGSSVAAALFIKIGNVVAKPVIVISIVRGDIHLIGKLMRVKLKSPARILRPAV